MRTLILGCGYVGAAVGRSLVERGDQVVGVCRTEESFASLRKLGIEPRTADLTSLDSMRAIEPKFDAVVSCASSSRRGAEAYRETYLKGTVNLIEWARTCPPQIVVFTGSTTVYPQTDGEWVDEESPTNPPHESGQILIETEALLLASPLPVTLIRLAAIYGPNRHAMLDKLRAGVRTLPGDGSHYLNMVHRDDIVAAIVSVLDQKPLGEIFNVVDDEPVRQVDYVCWLCEKLHLPMVKFDPRARSEFKDRVRKGFQPNRRVSNRKMKSRLRVQLRFPTFREGLLPLIDR